MSAKQLVSTRIRPEIWKEVRRLSLELAIPVEVAVESALNLWLEACAKMPPAQRERIRTHALAHAAVQEAVTKELTYSREDD